MLIDHAIYETQVYYDARLHHHCSADRRFALAAMTLRNLVHCALALAVTFLGLAAIYLQLNAQFVGFAQVLVYVGAVAILMCSPSC